MKWRRVIRIKQVRAREEEGSKVWSFCDNVIAGCP